jgi:hypothetical protein
MGWLEEGLTRTLCGAAGAERGPPMLSIVWASGPPMLSIGWTLNARSNRNTNML